ncbi:ribosome recycling factor family protein [Vibrio anguillarum]|uniref:ribosome recycling factor family protein n=1 Tax=Vibrio anguillarum TaxID=55601 RepID=UPI0003770D65|nr:ribosome recycling factor family protein [Vibrio anguillarum]OEE37664.1 ribosome recycling factor [Vibrio anguillarum]OEF89429.1 ribosome recycling factor [Vibrio anguillarum]
MAIMIITISLPSLIHRLGGENAKKAKMLAREYQCDLKRIRRSRNWQISGEITQLELLANRLRELDSLAMQFLITRLKDKLAEYQEQLEPKSAKLVRLVKQNPSITLAEFMHITHCTIAEARTARFNADSF